MSWPVAAIWITLIVCLFATFITLIIMATRQGRGPK